MRLYKVFLRRSIEVDFCTDTQTLTGFPFGSGFARHFCYLDNFKCKKVISVHFNNYLENAPNLCSNMNGGGRDFVIWSERIEGIMYLTERYLLSAGILSQSGPNSQYAINWGVIHGFCLKIIRPLLSHSQCNCMCVIFCFCPCFALIGLSVEIGLHFYCKAFAKHVYRLFQMKFENSCAGSLVEDLTCPLRAHWTYIENETRAIDGWAAVHSTANEQFAQLFTQFPAFDVYRRISTRIKLPLKGNMQFEMQCKYYEKCGMEEKRAIQLWQ